MEEFCLFLSSCCGGGEEVKGKGDYNWVSGDQVIKPRYNQVKSSVFLFG